MLAMIADYMENGFLENIVDMFKHDRSLYCHVPALMSDERGRVRLGTVALVEALKDEHEEEIVSSIPQIATLLGHSNPTIRADAAYLLGAIGHINAIRYLKDMRPDENEAVRQVVEETLNELSRP